MANPSNSISHQEYLKKYMSGDVKKKKRKVPKNNTSSIKRFKIIDDDIDLKSMRPLEDGEVELYQMDEDAPQIAGIIDERPAELKAQEYYNVKRWKVFGGEDGISVLDNMDASKKPFEPKLAEQDGKSKVETNLKEIKKKTPIQNTGLSTEGDDKGLLKDVRKKRQRKKSPDSDYSHPRINIASSSCDSDASPRRRDSGKRKARDENNTLKNKEHRLKDNSDSDFSPPRDNSKKGGRHGSPPTKYKHQTRQKGSWSDSDNSLPRPRKDIKTSVKSKDHRITNKSDSDYSPPRARTRKGVDRDVRRGASPPRKYKYQTQHKASQSDSDNSLPRSHKETKRLNKNKQHRLKDKSDSDCSPPRARRKEIDKDERHDSQSRKHKHQVQHKGSPSDSDNSPPRVRDHRERGKESRTERKRKTRSASDSDESPPRKDKSMKKPEALRRSRSSSPFHKQGKSDRYKGDQSKKDSFKNEHKALKRWGNSGDSDNSPPRKNKISRHGRSSSDLSPPRNSSKNDKPKKKVLYKPQDGFSSDEDSRSRSRKMKQTLDGKRAGLQDAKELKQELFNMKKREDEIFSKLDASVSGVGAAAIKRDRKTGQIRDLEKEKEAQREKEAKASVVNEKYSKWGKGLKQVADAATRAAEALKEMNKPLARYADDKDLDDFLKAQEREGDPMLDYIKQKQKEATPLVGEKPIYKGSYPPNRFGIRPGHRWDGVVRSSGYEKEWFTHQNAKKAVSEEAYKWSTSDM